MDLLEAAKEELSILFGPEAKFELREHIDPEAINPTPELFLVVQTRKSAEEAMKLLATFDDTWVDRISEHFTVTIEFPK